MGEGDAVDLNTSPQQHCIVAMAVKYGCGCDGLIVIIEYQIVWRCVWALCGVMPVDGSSGESDAHAV